VRAPAVLLLSLILLVVPASGLVAQEGEPLRFNIDPETGAAVVELLDLFSDQTLVEAVRSGLPLRIRVQIQLWKAGFFDNQKGDYDWRASVLFDPLTRRFVVQSSERTGAQVEVNTLDEARAALQTTLDVPLRPPEPGRYYYIAAVEMETLSLSDLEELQRWLQGELVPVVAGERDVEGALAKGFRRVLVRMLGLPAKRFHIQSGPFRIPSRPGGGDSVPPFLRPSAPTAGR
jgi:hypothetical protein